MPPNTSFERPGIGGPFITEYIETNGGISGATVSYPGNGLSRITEFELTGLTAAYVTEDGLTHYVTEDGLNIYVAEV